VSETGSSGSNAAEGLIRSLLKRRQAQTWSAFALRAPLRWGGPDFTTPVRAVAKSGPDGLRSGGIIGTTSKLRTEVT
jgi:hypothetical protein